MDTDADIYYKELARLIMESEKSRWAAGNLEIQKHQWVPFSPSVRADGRGFSQSPSSGRRRLISQLKGSQVEGKNSFFQFFILF